jgi:sigma-E factor negative regulatory protein RseA
MEQISAFMDGELDMDSAEREIARLKSESGVREIWDAYHLIGDAMRGSAPAMPGFAQRFGARLAAEHTVMAPQARRVPRKLPTYALRVAASVTAVAAVGWMGYGVMRVDAPQQIATAPAATVPGVMPAVVATPELMPVAAPDVVAVPAQHVQEYMLAHQGISPTTDIQGVTTYIRTVSPGDE